MSHSDNHLPAQNAHSASIVEWVRRFKRIKKELGYGIFCQNHEIFFDDNNAEIK